MLYSYFQKPFLLLPSKALNRALTSSTFQVLLVFGKTDRACAPSVLGSAPWSEKMQLWSNAAVDFSNDSNASKIFKDYQRLSKYISKSISKYISAYPELLGSPFELKTCSARVRQRCHGEKTGHWDLGSSTDAWQQRTLNLCHSKATVSPAHHVWIG